VLLAEAVAEAVEEEVEEEERKRMEKSKEVTGDHETFGLMHLPFSSR
jgi:hypothetical protein